MLNIQVRGELPANCTDDETMCHFLGLLNGPAFGLRIKFSAGPVRIRPQGPFYNFTVLGQENVAEQWVKNLILAIEGCGGNIFLATIDAKELH